MSHAEPERKSGQWLIGTGLLLVCGWLLIWFMFSSMTLAAWVAFAGGVAALGAAALLNARAVGRVVHAYWIVIVLPVVVVGGLLVVPASWVDAIRPAERVPYWAVRLVLVLLLLAAVGGIYSVTRDRSSFLHARAAVAANVELLVMLAVGALVAVNWIGSNPLSAKLGSYDTTEMRVYSLGDRTKQILDDLPGPVYATYLEFGSTFAAARGQEPLGRRGVVFVHE